MSDHLLETMPDRPRPIADALRDAERVAPIVDRGRHCEVCHSEIDGGAWCPRCEEDERDIFGRQW